MDENSTGQVGEAYIAELVKNQNKINDMMLKFMEKYEAADQPPSKKRKQNEDRITTETVSDPDDERVTLHINEGEKIHDLDEEHISGSTDQDPAVVLGKDSTPKTKKRVRE